MVKNEAKAENLEFMINNIAFSLVSENILSRNEIEKMLGVLVHDGFYAMWLYACHELKLEFQEDENKMKDTRLFKFLEKIAEIYNMVIGQMDYDGMAREIAIKTREIRELEREIKELEREIKGAAKEEKQNKIKEKDNKEDFRKEKEKQREALLYEYFLDLSKQLDNLIFFQGIWEKILVYARYHAKAVGDKK